HLRLPRLARVVVEIRHVMTRLVAVRVLPDQAGDVGLLASGRAALRSEQLIELACELAWATEQLHQAADVLRREERVLPRVCFGKRKRHFARFERLDPTTVAARPHKPRNGIE